MRILLPLLLVCLLAVSCVQQRKSHFTIGVSQCSEDQWRERANAELRREASFFDDLDLEIRSVADNSEEQIKDVEYFIDRKVDLLVISPNESSALTPVVSKAFRSGIPVILFDRKIDVEDYTAYVGADNRLIGVEIGEYLKTTYAGRPRFNLLVLRGTEDSSADTERYEGLITSLLDDRASKWQIVAEYYGNFTRKDAFSQTVAWLKANPDVHPDAVIAFNDQMALGARDAWNEAGGDSPVPAFFGVDALPVPGGGLEAILNGTLTASFIYSAGGEQIIDVARRILNHISFERTNYLNTASVDLTNARVLKLQLDQIDKAQEKLDAMSGRYQESMQLSVVQRHYLMAMLAILILAFALMGLIFIFYRRQQLLSQRIKSRNETIERQVTELEEQKRQMEVLTADLEKSTQAKLSFYTNVSHEFKTPLTLITGSLEELMDKPGLNAPTREALQVINRNSNKLMSLISEILDFRTFESGQMRVQNEPLDLRAFLESFNPMFQDMLRRRKLKLVFNVSDAAAFRMMMDKNKIEKIYFNLLSNALKHVGAGGMIVVGLQRSEAVPMPHFQLSVFNTGSYIPPEKREEIFRMFYRMDTDSESTGIGLTLTASLVQVLGGSISVESDPAIGTKFIVDIPFQAVAELTPAREPEGESLYTRRRLIAEDEGISLQDDILDEAADPGKASVLLIDDNSDMLHYIKGLLKPDYRVLVAQDGEKGLGKARQYLPDVVVCDIMMPGMDGYAVCRALKESQTTRHIPVILLTACSLDEQKAQGYESGADAYIQKPFNPSVLKARIQNLMEKNESMGETFGNDWLLGRKIGASSESAALVSKLKSHVEENMDKDISVEDLASSLGLSKASLYRKLHEVTDQSPVDLIRLIRLRHAVNLIRYEGRDISEAAFKSGFNSASYFSRTFQKYYKMSPREWIKKNG